MVVNGKRPTFLNPLTPHTLHLPMVRLRSPALAVGVSLVQVSRLHDAQIRSKALRNDSLLREFGIFPDAWTDSRLIPGVA